MISPGKTTRVAFRTYGPWSAASLTDGGFKGGTLTKRYPIAGMNACRLSVIINGKPEAHGMEEAITKTMAKDMIPYHVEQSWKSPESAVQVARTS